jgi:hypothetical protein
MRCDIASLDSPPVLLALIPPGDWGELESWRAEAGGRVSLRFASGVELLTPSAPPLLLLEQEGGAAIQIPIARPLPRGWPSMSRVSLPGNRPLAGSLDEQIFLRRGVWRVKRAGSKDLDAEVFFLPPAGEESWFRSGPLLIALRDGVVTGVAASMRLRLQSQLGLFDLSLPLQLEEAVEDAAAVWRRVARRVLEGKGVDPEDVRRLSLLRRAIVLLRAVAADEERPSRWLPLHPRGLMIQTEGGVRYASGAPLSGARCRIEWRGLK